MSRFLRTIRRRDVLAGGIAGGAAVIVAPAAAHASPAPVGNTALAAVSQVAGPGAAMVTVRSGDQPLEVVPVGFPEHWRFEIGDKVLVDLDDGVAYPHIKNVGSKGSVVVNVDPRLERSFP